MGWAAGCGVKGVVVIRCSRSGDSYFSHVPRQIPQGPTPAQQEYIYLGRWKKAWNGLIPHISRVPTWNMRPTYFVLGFSRGLWGSRIMQLASNLGWRWWDFNPWFHECTPTEAAVHGGSREKRGYLWFDLHWLYAIDNLFAVMILDFAKWV